MANKIHLYVDTSLPITRHPSSRMQSFASLATSQTIGSFGTEINKSYGGELEQPLGINIDDIASFTSKALNSRPLATSINHTGVLQTAGVHKVQQPSEFVSQVNGVESRPHSSHRGAQSWEESLMADTTSSRTDTSTDADADEKGTPKMDIVSQGGDSNDRSKERSGDQKTLRRLAQNREAARKSRLRKKVCSLYLIFLDV
eukprot:TRINITY_DN680_c0_g1_i4.p1 TRINITY_DN680_c0_g1~~TRINITY_DN680_c0_g1_i4.p1  ORF type:complete len:201 (-),score=15.23 TRINITY_DN680_c0_g1_i4:478-1080(-)